MPIYTIDVLIELYAKDKKDLKKVIKEEINDPNSPFLDELAKKAKITQTH